MANRVYGLQAVPAATQDPLVLRTSYSNPRAHVYRLLVQHPVHVTFYCPTNCMQHCACYARYRAPTGLVAIGASKGVALRPLPFARSYYCGVHRMLREDPMVLLSIPAPPLLSRMLAPAL